MRNPKISLVLFVACSLAGCTKQDGVSTRRPYVFTDISGHEYRGHYVQPQMPELVGKSGQLVVSYENGQKWMEGCCTNGQLDGPVRMWRKDGTLFIEENYRRGRNDGKLTWWHANGKKQMEVDWVAGKKNGWWLEWDENGNEVVRRQFKDDRSVK